MIELSEALGPVLLSKDPRDPNVLLAENNFVILAYVKTDDLKKIGTDGWFGPQEIWVEYIGAKRAAQWDDAPMRESAPTVTDK